MNLVYLGLALKGTQVHTLSLQYNKICADGAEKLGEVLKGTQVRTLILGGNQIGLDGSARLGKALEGTQVHTLSLQYNKIGDDGAARLGAALINTQVHTLHLMFNDIGDAGAEKLGKALKGTQVHTLELGLNNIGEKGAASLAACIPDTLLLKVRLDKMYPVLTKALETNAQKMMVTPYYLAHLARHLETSQSEIAPTNELDIFMSVGKDIQGHILGLFPLMTNKMVYKYQEIATKPQMSSCIFRSATL